MNEVTSFEVQLTDTPNLAAIPVETRVLLGALVRETIFAVRRETLAQLQGIKLELKAIVEDNSSLRSSISHLNEAMGKFREHEAMPLRDALQDFNTNAGSRVAENQANLEKLIQALTRRLEAANIPIPADIAQAIKDGRFEELKHGVANEGGGELRDPGSNPLEKLL